MDATEQRAAELEILNGSGAKVHDVADRAGLTADFLLTGSMWRVTVGRPKSNEPQDWSMEPVTVAIGRSIPDVSARAIAAIKAMAPQIAAKLDAASPEPSEVDPREERIAVALERIATALERMVADDD